MRSPKSRFCLAIRGPGRHRWGRILRTGGLRRVLSRTSSVDRALKLCPLTAGGTDLACVSTKRTQYGCASTSCSPCLLPNAQADCDPAGQCAILSCVETTNAQGNPIATWYDCNGTPSDGCESNTLQDPNNCVGVRVYVSGEASCGPERRSVRTRVLPGERVPRGFQHVRRRLCRLRVRILLQRRRLAARLSDGQAIAASPYDAGPSIWDTASAPPAARWARTAP